jgi:Meiotically Up-regulated Gene 113 (MUG113) protein
VESEALAGLRVAVSVATEGRGAVLYLALHQSRRVLQKRLRIILGEAPWPNNLLFLDEWPGLEPMEACLRSRPAIRWLLPDWNPNRGAERNMLQQLAERNAVTLLLPGAPARQTDTWKRERAQRMRAVQVEMPDPAARSEALERVRADMAIWVPPPNDDELARLASRDVGMVVYFLQGETGGNIKIGYAGDVAARVATFQPGSPVKLCILATQPGGQPLEAALHRRFAAHRLHGEWFAPCEDLLAYIAGLE